MAYGVFEEVKDASATGLMAINDHLRYLYSRVQGNMGLKELGGDVTGELDGKASGETVELQGYDVQDNAAASDSLAQRMGAAEVKLQADNIRLAVGEIGTSQLLYNSNFEFGLNENYSAAEYFMYGDALVVRDSAGDPFGTVTPRKTAIEQGKTYTLSFEASSYYSVATLNYCHLMSQSQGNFKLPEIPINGGDTVMRKYKCTFVAPYTASDVGILVAHNSDGASARGFRIRRLKLEEGSSATGWSPHQSELKSSSMDMDDDHIAFHTDELTIRTPDGESELLTFTADSHGVALTDLSVSGRLTLTGTVVTDDDGNIDVFQPSRTIHVSRVYGTAGNPALSTVSAATGTWPATCYFNTFASAMASLGRRLKNGVITINVYEGTYNECLTVDGFFGRGQVTVNLRGGNNAATRAIFTRGCSITNNAVPVTVQAWDDQSPDDSAEMPLIKQVSGGITLTVANNSGAVFVTGLCVQSAGANGAYVTASTAYLRYCCLEGAPSGSAGLAVYYSTCYVGTCTGTNAGYGIYITGGGHVIRLGKAPNGTPALLNAGGAYHDNGTVTPTASTGVPALPPAQVTKQFPCLWSRSWRHDGSSAKWRTTGTEIYQGAYGGDLVNYGCMLFGVSGTTAVAGAGSSQIPAGKTLSNFVSARLYFRRYGSSGSSAAMAVKLYALSNTDISLAAQPASGQTSAAPALNTAVNCALASLAWNSGGWFDIPPDLAYEVYKGRALCVYTAAKTPYGKFCGFESADYRPVIEVTYQ